MHGLERGGQAARRFEKDQGPLQRRKHLQSIHSLTGLRRQEPLKIKMIGRQARCAQGCDRRARARNRHNSYLFSMTGHDQLVTRIRDQWRTRVRNQRNRLACAQSLQHTL